MPAAAIGGRGVGSERAATRPRFDLAALRTRAGETVFARGVEYHRDDAVAIVAIDKARVVADVAGSEAYRVELTGRGTTIGGSCSCPAFSDRGFCKHMVATALAANAGGDEAEREAEDRLARIREHLGAKTPDQLVAMVMELASRDRDLLQKLDLAAAKAHGDERAIEAQLGKAVDVATRMTDPIGYREASAWADRVEAVLEAVAELVPAGQAGAALRLVEQAIGRIEDAAPSIDDSEGHCGGLLHQAQEIHLAAVSALRPEPVGLARDLFAREMEGDYEAFAGAAGTYAEMLGEAGLAEYRRLAMEAWEKSRPAPRNGRERPASSGGDYRLRQMIDHFAEREGDVEARIALRARDLTSPYGYLALAEFCLKLGREEEALRRAEEGLWIFEDGRQDGRLVLFAAGLLEKAGRHGEAEAHLWRAFEAAPDLDLYLRLRPLAGEAACDRALASIEARRTKAKGPPVRWGLGGPPDDLPVRILIHEGRFDRAWEAFRRHTCSAGTKEALARASEATHGAEALAVYRALVEDLAQLGGEGSYRRAKELVDRIAGLQGRGDHAAYLASLKERHKRRRNLMKLLG